MGLLLAVAVVAVAAIVVSVAAAGSSSNGPPQTRIYGGGNVPIGTCTDGATPFCSTQFTREFSINAVRDPNENVTYGTITLGSVQFGGVISAVRVTCLAVSGNVAEVGGVIVQSPDPSRVGWTFNLFVRDSGQPGTAARDGVSPFFSGPPAGNPPTCRDVSSDAFGSGYFPLTYGDIAIEKVTSQNG